MPTILFVQGNSADGDTIRNALANQGWHVNMARNAGEALRSAAKHAPNLVLVDGTLAEAASLLKSFSLKNGGPGAVVISPGSSSATSHLGTPPDGPASIARTPDVGLSKSPPLSEEFWLRPRLIQPG